MYKFWSFVSRTGHGFLCSRVAFEYMDNKSVLFVGYFTLVVWKYRTISTSFLRQSGQFLKLAYNLCQLHVFVLEGSALSLASQSNKSMLSAA